MYDTCKSQLYFTKMFGRPLLFRKKMSRNVTTDELRLIRNRLSKHSTVTPMKHNSSDIKVAGSSSYFEKQTKAKKKSA